MKTSEAECRFWELSDQFQISSTSIRKRRRRGRISNINELEKTISLTKKVCKAWLLGDSGEGNGTPLQYSCLENPIDRGVWWAVVHGVAKSQTQLSDFTFTFHFHALEKELATHSSVLVWRIPGTEEPGGLPSMGSHRFGHNWSDLAALAAALGDREWSQQRKKAENLLPMAFRLHQKALFLVFLYLT